MTPGPGTPSSRQPPSARTFLGVDYGTKHVGVAVGGSASGLAEGLGNVSVRGGEPDWARISRLISEWQPDALVVGLPLNMDDSDNDMTRAARRFGQWLRDRYNLPVHMVDERLTTRVATDLLIEAGVPFRRRKARLDRLAARTILQAFLDERSHAARD
jgi:putative Holliday junction resolvase